MKTEGGEHNSKGHYLVPDVFGWVEESFMIDRKMIWGHSDIRNI